MTCFFTHHNHRNNHMVMMYSTYIPIQPKPLIFSIDPTGERL